MRMLFIYNVTDLLVLKHICEKERTIRDEVNRIHKIRTGLIYDFKLSQTLTLDIISIAWTQVHDRDQQVASDHARNAWLTGHFRMLRPRGPQLSQSHIGREARTRPIAVGRDDEIPRVREIIFVESLMQDGPVDRLCDASYPEMRHPLEATEPKSNVT